MVAAVIKIINSGDWIPDIKSDIKTRPAIKTRRRRVVKRDHSNVRKGRLLLTQGDEKKKVTDRTRHRWGCLIPLKE